MIELSAITKQFGQYPALHGIDLNVAKGEFIALLGPSGSGKTTLLRIIAGLETQDGGTVKLGGEDVSRRKVADRGVGFVFQQYALFRHMTVAENIGFGLSVRPRRTRPARAAIRVTQALAGLLQDRTYEGYVFRVDLRLRPDPSSTPAAVSTPAAFGPGKNSLKS